MKKATEVCLGLLSAVLLLLTLVSLGGIIGLGAIGIVAAGNENDQRYRNAYCDDSDLYEHEWLFWMAGASASIVPFWLFGTLAITLVIVLIREGEDRARPKKGRVEVTWQREDHIDGDKIEMTEKSKSKPKPPPSPSSTEGDQMDNSAMVDVVEGENFIHLKQAPLQKMTCGAVTSVFLTLFFLSLAFLCMLWGIAIAYDNARTPNKTVSLYIGVDVLIGIAMPLFLIFAAATVSVFLEYITDGRIDTRDIIAKMLSIQLVKGKKSEYWVIQNLFYFQLSSHDTQVRKAADDAQKKTLTCTRACSRTNATWILATIASLGFLLSVSYFMDRTVTRSQTLQDWPHRSVGDVDCFLTNSFLYVSPNEQELTDRLHNCTVFFQQCQQNCSSSVGDEFRNCIMSCSSCLAVCTTSLQADLDRQSVCEPPPPPEAPLCPVSTASCLTPASPPSPSSVNTCPTAVSAEGSGLSAAEIAPIRVTNNTERLQRCAELLQTCSVQNCTSPSCQQLQECNMLLQECRKPPVILCFQFLQFGRSSNVLEALSESFALFLTVLSFFSATFVAVRILLQFKVTKWWGLGFVLVAILLTGVWMAVIGLDILVQENIIQLFQFFFGFSYIFLIGILLLTARFWEKVPDPKKFKQEAHLMPVSTSVV